MSPEHMDSGNVDRHNPREGAPQWHGDLLGPDYQSMSLVVPARANGGAPVSRSGGSGGSGGSRGSGGSGVDGEGGRPASATFYRATLVRHKPLHSGIQEAAMPAAEKRQPADGTGPAVLFIHGWSDYFFNTGLAEFFTSHGFAFYALDLHNHGRSLDSPELGGYVADLADYDAEILAAHAIISAEVEAAERECAETGSAEKEFSEAAAGISRPLILMGHSTGGLIAALWAHHHPGLVSHLILNSPWLEIQGGPAIRRAASPLVQLADFRPLMRMRVPERSFYWRGISREAYGEWAVDKKLRPPHAFPVRAGWMRAILAAQQEVAGGLKLPMPVLVLLSSRSLLGPVWNDQMLMADVVLDVRSLALRTLSLGNSVTLERIDGALHEVFLSREPVRADGYTRLARWLRGYVD